REELLGHLTAIFEEELEKLGDERAALDRAKQRFGDPHELTGQLQESVPRFDRIARLMNVDLRRPDESLLHFAGRISSLGLAMSAVAILLLWPVACLHGRQSEIALRLYVLYCISILNIPLTVGVILLVDGMYRALHRDRSARSWRLAVVYGLMSMAFFPALAFLWYVSLTGDLALSFEHLRFACCFAPLGPVLFAALSKQAVAQMRYEEQWAGLEIGE
ncbi:MAG: hypothetical protein ACWGMZ_07365, partial [Thermoguttaceae bacterium]